MELIDTLTKIIEGDVEYDDATLEAHSVDTSIFKIRPVCVVFPKHVEDVKVLVRFADEHPDLLTLTARSAGTDMTGGPLTNSVVVSFIRYFNTIKEIGEGYAVVEPGVYYRDFERETLKKGYLLPSYTASRELNTVGGMVANNSGGEKSLRYGKTDRYVRALKVVLRDGNEYTIPNKLTRLEMERKKELPTFEGKMYRAMHTLIEAKHGLIESRRPIVSKNSAGYALWDVWDIHTDTFDFTRLFTGSQGTLGFVTEITFELVKPKEHARMLVIFLRKRHMKILGELVNVVLRQGPESFESYDDNTFKVMLQILPSLLKRLHRNLFGLARDFLPEIKLVATGGIPKLVLMAEFTGDTEEEVERAVARAEKAVHACYKVTTHRTKSKAEGEKFWVIRRESFNILRQHVHEKHTAPFIDDVSVPPHMLPEFLPKLYAVMGEYKLTYTIAGHVGDGNFHIIPLMDYKNKNFSSVIDELSRKVYALVIEHKGSITGEHNDGIIRTPYLEQMFGKDMINLFVNVKDIFDPHRIFNPHKKVEGDVTRIKNAIRNDL